MRIEVEISDAAFRAAAYKLAGPRPAIGVEEPEWLVDLFDVEMEAMVAEKLPPALDRRYLTEANTWSVDEIIDRRIAELNLEQQQKMQKRRSMTIWFYEEKTSRGLWAPRTTTMDPALDREGGPERRHVQIIPEHLEGKGLGALQRALGEGAVPEVTISAEAVAQPEVAAPAPSEWLAGPFGFGTALDALEHGNRLARAGWNGKGMWIEYQAPNEFGTPTLPYLIMRTADAHWVPWLASQTDILAKDWSVV